MKIGCQEDIMRVLDYLFGVKPCIYTSLTFEYGTEQPIHRDAPFSHTFPENYFVGVWCALEDIDPAWGPLMFVPRGHRFNCIQYAIYKKMSVMKIGRSRGIGCWPMPLKPTMER